MLGCTLQSSPVSLVQNSVPAPDPALIGQQVCQEGVEHAPIVLQEQLQQHMVLRVMLRLQEA